jgi:hypothetical protein
VALTITVVCPTVIGRGVRERCSGEVFGRGERERKEEQCTRTAHMGEKGGRSNAREHNRISTCVRWCV